jgi:uncharacterized protein
MKFLAFVDLHQDLTEIEVIRRKIEHENVDFLVCAGDFSIFGNNMIEILLLMETLNKPIYLIHGNHETESELKAISDGMNLITFSHKKIIEIDDFLFVFFGGGGFSESEPQFEKMIKKNRQKLKESKKIILVTHAPPKNTDLDEISIGMHVGVKDFRKFIDNYNPLLSISGHIHETYKRKQQIGNTILINPGWDGEIFEFN